MEQSSYTYSPDGKQLLDWKRDYTQKSIVVSEGAEVISAGAFRYGDYTEVTLPDSLTTIESGAFKGALNLTNISLSKNLRFIGDYAFEVCSSINNINLPENLESIGAHAFERCGLTKVFIPKNVSHIGDCPFLCEGLVSIDVDDNNSYFCSVDGMLLSKDKKVLVQFPTGKTDDVYIPEGVEEIRPYAFKGVKFEETLYVPSSVIKIGVHAFDFHVYVDNENPIYSSEDGCLYDKNKTKLIQVPHFLKKAQQYPDTIKIVGEEAFTNGMIEFVAIPQGVEIIEDRAFKNCPNLSCLELPSTICHIGESVFGSFSNVKKLRLPKGYWLRFRSSFLCNQFCEDFEIEEYNYPTKEYQGAKNITKEWLDDYDGDFLFIPYGSWNAYHSVFGEDIKLIELSKTYVCCRLKRLRDLVVSMLKQHGQIGLYQYSDMKNSQSTIVCVKFGVDRMLNIDWDGYRFYVGINNRKLYIGDLFMVLGFDATEYLKKESYIEDIEIPNSSMNSLVGRKLAKDLVITWTEDVVDEETFDICSINRKEVLLSAGEYINAENWRVLIDSQVNRVMLYTQKQEFACWIESCINCCCNSRNSAFTHIYTDILHPELKLYPSNVSEICVHDELIDYLFSKNEVNQNDLNSLCMDLLEIVKAIYSYQRIPEGSIITSSNQQIDLASNNIKISIVNDFFQVELEKINNYNSDEGVVENTENEYYILKSLAEYIQKVSSKIQSK